MGSCVQVLTLRIGPIPSKQKKSTGVVWKLFMFVYFTAAIQNVWYTNALLLLLLTEHGITPIRMTRHTAPTNLCVYSSH